MANGPKRLDKLSPKAAAAGLLLWMWRQDSSYDGWTQRSPAGCPFVFWEKGGHRIRYSSDGWEITGFLRPGDHWTTDSPIKAAALAAIATARGCSLADAARAA